MQLIKSIFCDMSVIEIISFIIVILTFLITILSLLVSKKSHETAKLALKHSEELTVKSLYRDKYDIVIESAYSLIDYIETQIFLKLHHTDIKRKLPKESQMDQEIMGLYYVFFSRAVTYIDERIASEIDIILKKCINIANDYNKDRETENKQIMIDQLRAYRESVIYIHNQNDIFKKR